FGGSGELRHTFDISDALREIRAEQCPLCDERIRISERVGRSSSWTSIPRERARLESALVVYYYDLDRDKIPSRYDALLPMPTAQIAAYLQKGEALVAAKERPGAPPVILVAAPRAAQLQDVEAQMATWTKLPLGSDGVKLVKIDAELRRDEIRAE